METCVGIVGLVCLLQLIGKADDLELAMEKNEVLYNTRAHDLFEQLNDAKKQGHLEAVAHLEKEINEHLESKALFFPKPHKQEEKFVGHITSSRHVKHGTLTPRAKL